jgi:hypothetical protein
MNLKEGSRITLQTLIDHHLAVKEEALRGKELFDKKTRYRACVLDRNVRTKNE